MRSTRPDAAMPATVTTSRKTIRPASEKGISQSARSVTALPTVPGATGA